MGRFKHGFKISAEVLDEELWNLLGFPTLSRPFQKELLCVSEFWNISMESENDKI